MSYNANIPQSTDRPSQSQSQLLTNFQQLDSIFAINHVTFDDATVANRGKHIYVTLIDETGSPPTPTGTDIALYSAQASGLNQLFMIQGAVGTPVQITGAGSPGSSFEIRGGQFTVPTSSTAVNVTFSSAFPNSITSVTFAAANFRAGAFYVNSPYISAQSTTGFSFQLITAATSALVYNYIAIGS